MVRIENNKLIIEVETEYPVDTVQAWRDALIEAATNFEKLIGCKPDIFPNGNLKEHVANSRSGRNLSEKRA